MWWVDEVPTLAVCCVPLLQFSALVFTSQSWASYVIVVCARKCACVRVRVVCVCARVCFVTSLLLITQIPFPFLLYRPTPLGLLHLPSTLHPE